MAKQAKAIDMKDYLATMMTLQSPRQIAAIVQIFNAMDLPLMAHEVAKHEQDANLPENTQAVLSELKELLKELA